VTRGTADYCPGLAASDLLFEGEGGMGVTSATTRRRRRPATRRRRRRSRSQARRFFTLKG